VARLVAASEQERQAPARALFYRYAREWRSPDPIGPEFLLHGEHLCYVFPSDAGVACLAVSVPVADYELVRDDAAGFLERTFRANPQTANRMDRLAWVSGVFTGLPTDCVWRAACGPGWALVGDAGTVQDPWAGLGMDTAARQAESFVEAFSAGAWETVYPRLRRERTYSGHAETTRLAPDLRQLLDPGPDLVRPG
jgi:2-polyprenyl-6-methoxyphenol hydroxylase-like FAD-dependent oxidoreductase